MEMENPLRERAAEFGQDHVFRFWDMLSETERACLLEQLAGVDFPLIQRLAETWVLNEPAPEHFQNISPVQVIPLSEPGGEAWDAGEAALRDGKVGLFLVAGGQGTRLGFEGPKGAYPIGPITGKTLFAYHAEKIRNLQHRYSCTLPWYIMVSDANAVQTQAFFEAQDYFGLKKTDIHFLTQRMMPCLDASGKFMLEAPGRLAMNPNGHGGCIPAMVDNGILDDARARGVQLLSYFQVDNWAVKVADPRFIGYHVLRNAEMSSKNHRRNGPREAVGVHCLCDGEYRVIEYSELDLYPQLLEVDGKGDPVHFAGNPAIHILSVEFVQRVNDHFETFPWHRAHKKIPYVNESGELIQPAAPNGYKFETFVFDALRFTRHQPVALEILHEGEYTPIKQFDGDNSVTAARQTMAGMWAKWLDAAGNPVPRTPDGACAIPLEISPEFALRQDEFVEKSQGRQWSVNAPLAIEGDGALFTA